MKDSTVELYSNADLSRLEHRIKRWSLALFLLAIAALAVCVVLITLTGNLWIYRHIQARNDGWACSTVICCIKTSYSEPR